AFSSWSRRDFTRSTASSSCGGSRAVKLGGAPRRGGRRPRAWGRAPGIAPASQGRAHLGIRRRTPASRWVRGRPRGAVGSLAYVADALPQAGEQSLLTDNALAVEHEAVQRLTSQRAHEQVILPFREEIARVEGRAGGSDGGVPIVDRLLHAGLMGALADFGIVIVATIGDDRPAVILAGFWDVDLVAAARPVLDGPQLARRRIACGTLHVAVADGPDLRPPTVLLWVARIRAPVGHEAHELAQMIGWVLRLGARRVALTQRHVE